MFAAVAASLVPACAWFGMHAWSSHASSLRSHATKHLHGRARQHRAHSAIVGGHFAGNGQFPWLARVVAHVGRVVDGCSGTVVATDLVLTAGHCVEDIQTGIPLPASEFEVQTAHLSGHVASRPSRVTRVLVYPGFDRQSGVGDAALLELSTRASAPSIQLASEAGNWPAGTHALMAGWGHAGAATPPTLAPLLRWASTVLQSPQSCAARLRGFSAGGELCAINAPSDDTAGCAGDSGGPLLVKRGGETMQIGVLNGSVRRDSRTVTCVTTEPTVYASSSLISGWVHETIQRKTSVPIAVTEVPPAR
jgi:secreted trypsin-like serine protease